MIPLAFMRFELLRTFRNRRFFVFSLAFPLILYFFIAGPTKDVDDLNGSGISAPLYFMTGIAAFGGMNAMLSTGARIADERGRGWNRQLRLTPLKTRQYLAAKVTTGYLMATLTLTLMFVSGAILGVRMPAPRWLEMVGLMLIGLLPFAALGVFVGHLVTSDSMGPDHRRRLVAAGAARRHVVSARRQRISLRGRARAAVVLARAGQPPRDRRLGVGRARVGRGARVERRARPARRARVSARHAAGLTRSVRGSDQGMPRWQEARRGAGLTP